MRQAYVRVCVAPDHSPGGKARLVDDELPQVRPDEQVPAPTANLLFDCINEVGRRPLRRNRVAHHDEQD